MIRQFFAAVVSLAILTSISHSATRDEPAEAQLARSDGSVPSVPILEDTELTYERLKPLLQSKSHLDRYTGAANLARCSICGWKGTTQQADELATLALSDVYWAVRYEGAKFAHFRGKNGAGIIPALVAALDSEEPVVRGKVALAIAQTGGADKALPRLKEMLAAADRPLEVATALCGTDTGRKALQQLASSTNATTRMFANAGLSKASDGSVQAATESYLQDLSVALASKDAATVILACKSVELAGGKAAGAGSEIASLLSNADLGIRLAAAEAALQSAPGGDVAVAEIIKALDDKEIRIKCILTLGRIGEKARSAIPALTRMIEKDRTLSDVVIDALTKIAPQSPDTLPIFMKVLKGSLDAGRPDEKVIIALGCYGPDAKAAVPNLIKALQVKGDHPYYVPAAIWALGQIGPDAAEACPHVEKYLKGIFADIAITAIGRMTAKDPTTMPAQSKYPGPGLLF